MATPSSRYQSPFSTPPPPMALSYEEGEMYARNDDARKEERANYLENLVSALQHPQDVNKNRPPKDIHSKKC